MNDYMQDARQNAVTNKKFNVREGFGPAEVQTRMYQSGDLLGAGTPQLPTAQQPTGDRAVDTYTDQERALLNQQHQQQIGTSANDAWAQYESQQVQLAQEPTYEQKVAARNKAIDAQQQSAHGQQQLPTAQPVQQGQGWFNKMLNP